MYFGIRAGHQYILKGKSINYTLRLKMRTQQPRCPSIAAWINKLWYIYTTEYYSAMIINKLPSHDKGMEKTNSYC